MLTISALFIGCALFAEVWLPAIFSDNMVLQREIPVKIWGKANPKTVIGVILNGQRKTATVDAKGKWSITFDPLSTHKDGFDIQIYENGKVVREIKDVLIGEVWILGGQSNMEWILKNTTDATEAIKRAEKPTLRYFSQYSRAIAEKPQENSPDGAKWIVCNPKDAENFSAVGYYFAEKLASEMDGVPVGLIATPRGGSAMIAWIPEEKLANTEYTKARKAKFDENKVAYSYEKSLEKYNADKKKYDADTKKFNEDKKKYDELVAKAKAENKTLDAKANPEPKKPAKLRSAPIKLTPWNEMSTPSYLFNAKIAPIAGFSARGVLWYQGESDSSGSSLKDFGNQFKLVVESWRELWGMELPFIFAQLTSYENKNDWPQTRWEQFLTTKNIPKVYMAVTIDIGEKNDIHPREKTKVGHRMEGIAMKEVYKNSKVKPYGPVFKEVKYSQAGTEVVFNTDGKELKTEGGAKGFELKINGAWVKAEANVNKTTGLVRLYPSALNLKKAKVQGVRYLWKNWAQDDLWIYSSDGIPATTFIDERQ